LRAYKYHIGIGIHVDITMGTIYAMCRNPTKKIAKKRWKRA
jgi:hypothetical protein